VLGREIERHEPAPPADPASAGVADWETLSGARCNGCDGHHKKTDSGLQATMPAAARINNARRMTFAFNIEVAAGQDRLRVRRDHRDHVDRRAPHTRVPDRIQRVAS